MLCLRLSLPDVGDENPEMGFDGESVATGDGWFEELSRSDSAQPNQSPTGRQEIHKRLLIKVL